MIPTFLLGFMRKELGALWRGTPRRHGRRRTARSPELEPLPVETPPETPVALEDASESNQIAIEMGEIDQASHIEPIE